MRQCQRHETDNQGLCWHCGEIVNEDFYYHYFGELPPTKGEAMRNDYHERQERKRDRFEELAEKNESIAESAYDRSTEMAKSIPFGQPILVGHHSEKRDRSFRERIAKTAEKSFAALERAKHYKAKAASLGTGGISQDDPDAIAKLRENLAEREAFQNQVKTDNAKLRKAKLSADDPELQAKMEQLGISAWSQKEIILLSRICPYHVRPYVKVPAYSLKNNNAQIRRIKQRIEQLAQLPDEDAPAEMLAVDPADSLNYCKTRPDLGRVVFHFNGKPSEEIRAELKSWGFRWSRNEGLWLRHLNRAGRFAAVSAAVKFGWNEL